MHYSVICYLIHPPFFLTSPQQLLEPTIHFDTHPLQTEDHLAAVRENYPVWDICKLPIRNQGGVTKSQLIHPLWMVLH